MKRKFESDKCFSDIYSSFGANKLKGMPSLLLLA